MQRMNGYMMHFMSPHMLILAAVILLLASLAIMAVIFFSRRVTAENLPVSSLLRGREDPFLAALDGSQAPGPPAGQETHDTLFILPDISHYTRFMTGNRFEFGHAQHIVFCLINAMIEAATKTVELSKLEGDAALFFTDAGRHSPARLGETVMDIFRGFFREQRRLIAANMCPCRACRSIDQLDLKIFVHRGHAARFRFRGSVDHFGLDVIILHRIMKNSVGGSRYVMITDAAADSIRLPERITPQRIRERVADVGVVGASVYEIDDALAAQLAQTPDHSRTSRLLETGRKLRENLRLLRSALRRARQSAAAPNP
ncbi:MAG: hypothetical protein Kow0032_11280 [Methyloligellaceae bacterium]